MATPEYNAKFHDSAFIAADYLGLINKRGIPSMRRIAKGICAMKGIKPPYSDRNGMRLFIMNFAATIGQSIPQPKRPVVVVTVVDQPKPAPIDFYATEEWRALRYDALKAANGACQLCGSGPHPGKPLHVDHIKPKSRYPELALNPSNLQVLCADCNLGKSNRDTTDWRTPRVSVKIEATSVAGEGQPCRSCGTPVVVARSVVRFNDVWLKCPQCGLRYSPA